MRAVGALAAGLLALAGCRREEAPRTHTATPVAPASPTASAVADAGAALAPLGVQAPLPLEWSLSPGADGSLRAGPRGRSVLRIDRAPAGTPRPSPKDLAEGFQEGLKGLSATVLRTEEDATFSGVVLSVSHAQGDTLSSHPVFLGAKQAGALLYLCATTPGSSLTELARAGALCHALEPARR